MTSVTRSERRPSGILPGREWFDAEYLAGYFGVSRKTILRWTRKGQLRGKKFGQKWMYSREEIRRFELEEGEVIRSEPPCDVPNSGGQQ